MEILRTYLNERKHMDLFLSKYDQYLHYQAPPSRPKNRIPKKQRFCRFCQRQSPEVSFKNEPHIIPELLGKNYGVSDIECDACNAHFGVYESDFAQFLGLIRSFYFVEGKGNIPNFTSPGESLIARLETLTNGSSAMGITDTEHGAIYIDMSTGETTISYLKNAYTPINVFKSLVKVALTILPFEDFRFYGNILRFISHEENHEYFTQFAKIFSYTTSDRREKPCCYIFKRKDDAENIPKHIFMLYFENFIYEFFIPLYAPDSQMYENRQFSSIYCPPIIIAESDLDKCCWGEIIDFTSTEKRRKEKGLVSYQLTSEHFANAEMIDPITKKKSPFDPKAIKKISIFKIDENFDREGFETGSGFI